MSDVIIDTNVVVVANRQNLKVMPDCADACIFFLLEARKNHVVLLDGDDEIRGEYARAVRMGRPYQLGAQFLIHVLQHQFNPAHARRVDLGKTGASDFADFPTAPELAAFDPSDRKFAALARKTGIAVTNAIDSDWADHLAALNAHDIAVKFLCGCDKAKWHKK